MVLYLLAFSNTYIDIRKLVALFQHVFFKTTLDVDEDFSSDFAVHISWLWSIYI